MKEVFLIGAQEVGKIIPFTVWIMPFPVFKKIGQKEFVSKKIWSVWQKIVLVQTIVAPNWIEVWVTAELCLLLISSLFTTCPAGWVGGGGCGKWG